MRRGILTALLATVCPLAASHAAGAPVFTVSPEQTLEAPGVSVVIDHNKWSPIFFDEKNAGIQIILHDERIAVDGDVRLSPTPEQWDPVPTFIGRTVETKPSQVVVRGAYPDKGLNYRIRVTPEGDGFRIAVDLDQPLPASLAGKAGFNLDFLPTDYFGKAYYLDGAPGLFPRDAIGPMKKDGSGDPQPLASGGRSLTLSPEDPDTRVTVTSDKGALALYDARNRAQNGWFVVRSLIAPGATTDAVVWHVKPAVDATWVRQPVVSYNQAGYTPGRSKVAVIELDPRFKAAAQATLMKLTAAGKPRPVLTAAVKPWGKWLRYRYATFDFSTVRDPGLYAISYAGHLTSPFAISPDAYDHIWQASLDTYLAEQMDHVKVREQYRIWQSPSHLDDARQAPPNITHFDGYRMGPNLDSPFKAGEHIPLAVGGWQDAGDYDIQTPSNASVVRDLVWGRELFGLDWDETTVDEAARSVQIRKPDGVQDSLQQIRHGTLQLLAQYNVFGHAIVGIVDPTLQQYTHLGDAGSQSDGRIYDPKLGANEIKGDYSGNPDDRWAFTTDYAANDLAMAGALAGASRALREADPKLAGEALAAAKALWQAQRSRIAGNADPSDGRGSGGRLDMSDVEATVELLMATNGDALYRNRIEQLLPAITQNFGWVAADAVRAIPYMGADYKAQLVPAVRALKQRAEAGRAKNPFGVPIGEGSWAGSNEVATFASTMYLLHSAFPEIVGTQYTLDAIDYLLGRHPANNLSLVSTVGTQSKLVAYGHNRADYSFVAGGLVPGVLIVKPDFPELRTQWPFLWFENEYTVSTTSAYILAANAAIAVTEKP